MNRTLKDIFWSSRPFSWINTAIPFLLGAWLGAGHLTLPLIIGTIYFTFPFNLLLYGINDIFDYESDIKNPRKAAESIEGSVIARSRHKRLAVSASIINLPFLIYLFIVASFLAQLVLLALLATTLAYSVKFLRFKEVPFLDSITSSSHFFGPFLVGLTLCGATQLYLPGLAAFVLWGCASHAFGAVQDIVYDRQAGIGSIAATLGGRATMRLTTIAYALAAIIAGLAYGLWVGLILSLFAISTARWWNLPGDEAAASTNRGWRDFMWLNLLVGFWLAQILLYRLNPFGLSLTMRLHLVTGMLITVNLIFAWILLSRTKRLPALKNLLSLDMLSHTQTALSGLSKHHPAKAMVLDISGAYDHVNRRFVAGLALITLGGAAILMPYLLWTQLAFISDPLSPIGLLACIAVQFCVYAASAKRLWWTMILYPILIVVELVFISISMAWVEFPVTRRLPAAEAAPKARPARM